MKQHADPAKADAERMLVELRTSTLDKVLSGAWCGWYLSSDPCDHMVYGPIAAFW